MGRKNQILSIMPPGQYPVIKSPFWWRGLYWLINWCSILRLILAQNSSFILIINIKTIDSTRLKLERVVNLRLFSFFSVSFFFFKFVLHLYFYFIFMVLFILFNFLCTFILFFIHCFNYFIFVHCVFFLSLFVIFEFVTRLFW